MVLENGPRALWERLGRIFTVCCTSVYIALDPSSKGHSHPTELRSSWIMNWPMSETCVRDLEFPLWQLRLGFFSSDLEFFHLYISSSILENCPSISSPGTQGTTPCLNRWKHSDNSSVSVTYCNHCTCLAVKVKQHYLASKSSSSHWDQKTQKIATSSNISNL